MKIIWAGKIDLKKLGIATDCEIFAARIKIDDVDKRANEMIQTISDTSWISRLEAIPRSTFIATSARTIEKLVKNIHERIDGDKLTEEFGEYLVSDTSQCVLVDQFNHTKVPLAEIFKARISGNEGFDFHSECSNSFIAFGEAKYSGGKSPYAKALAQIVDFVDQKKDDADLVYLMHLVSSTASVNCSEGLKSYAAAFSINAVNPDLVIEHALKSESLTQLLGCKKIYLVGVEVDDPKLN